MNWSDVVEGFWLAREWRFSQNTVKGYNIVFARFGGFMGDIPIEAMTAKKINAYMTWERMERKLSTKSLLNVWTALRSIWGWAAPELNITNVMLKIEKPVAKSRPQDPYTEQEVAAFLKVCATMKAWDPWNHVYTDGQRPSHFRDVAIIIMLVDTGIRATELTSLTIADYDKSNGKITIKHGKGDKERVVYLGQTAQRALWRYLAKRPNKRPTDGLFLNQDEQPLEYAGLHMMIRRAGDRAGVTQPNVHRFRHTFAINFLRNGGSLFALQMALGHSTLEMVRRYSKMAEIDQASAQKIASPADKWRLKG